MRDNLFAKKINLSDFCFNQKVANVFDDMIKRSVPGYTNILELIHLISNIYAKKNTNLYDLGCSTGATSISLNNINNPNIIAIDNSLAMVKKCKINLKKLTNIKVIYKNIEDVKIENASIVALNLTLQFIAKNKRDSLIKKIHQGLNYGGALIVSEKVHFINNNTNQFINNLHLNFKKENGYSDLEINNKRQMLENILTTDNKQEHLSRLKNAGFNIYEQIFQSLNFKTFIAVK